LNEISSLVLIGLQDSRSLARPTDQMSRPPSDASVPVLKLLERIGNGGSHTFRGVLRGFAILMALLALCMNRTEPVFVKRKEHFGEDRYADHLSEVEIRKQLLHPNVTRFIDLFVPPPLSIFITTTTTRMRDQSNNIIMIEEYCSLGDLYNMIDSETLTESEMRRYFGHVVCMMHVTRSIVVDGCCRCVGWSTYTYVALCTATSSLRMWL
jgi:serine/threonine protein kinase